MTVRVESSPPGALVLLSRRPSFYEKSAQQLGRTPLMRWMAMPESEEWRVQISRRGCKEWEGALSAASPAISARLECPPDAPASPAPSLSALRARLVVADVLELDGQTPIAVNEEQSFRSMIEAQLESALAERHGERVRFEAACSDEAREDMRVVGDRLVRVRGDKVPYYTEALRVPPDFPLLRDLGGPDDGVLLIEVTGHVPSTQQRLARARDALAAGLAAAAAGGVAYVPPSARPDHLTARLIAVRGGDRELLLLDTIRVTGIPTDPKVGSALAEQIALAIPRGWFAAR